MITAVAYERPAEYVVGRARKADLSAAIFDGRPLEAARFGVEDVERLFGAARRLANAVRSRGAEDRRNVEGEARHLRLDGDACALVNFRLPACTAQSKMSSGGVDRDGDSTSFQMAYDATAGLR